MNAKQNPWQQGLHIFVIELDFFFLVNCFFLLLSELLDELSSGLIFFSYSIRIFRRWPLLNVLLFFPLFSR
jgi:hypothetical protein